MTALLSHAALRRRPDELVHLELESHVEFVRQNPFHDFARIDPAEDGREQDGVTTGREIEALHFVARPFVIVARADYEFHFVALGQILDNRKSTRLNSSHRCISYAV